MKEFYGRVEQILVSRFSDHGRNQNLKSLVYKCLDDVIIDPASIELGPSLGRGSSSEVLYGQYKYVAVAVKKIFLEGFNEKQLVTLDLSLVQCVQRDIISETGPTSQYCHNVGSGSQL